MTKLEIPRQLRELLEGSPYLAAIQALADRVAEILADNQLPFFPDYTDHGIEHIGQVLKTQVELIPKDVWNNSTPASSPRLLCDADAAVLIGGTLLHDIAMHLRPAGFLELVSDQTRFKPLPWFNKRQEQRPNADLPWPDLWADYVREARRFSDRDLTNIVGQNEALNWKFAGLPAQTGQWTRNDHLIVGEFIRRHHARLAHEIAIFGFPGIPVGSGVGEFPAIGTKGHTLEKLGDLIGLTARSHGMSLRVCQDYLAASPVCKGTPRPMGTAVLYPMALLRVADYLQIDQQRAPAVLLQLRDPQSPISIQEWQKHRAVTHIGPSNDPRGRFVTVDSAVTLPVYLQLQELLDGLQKEIDHSTAVLDEAYGTFRELGLNQLGLDVRRVHSNMDTAVFQDSLPFVPKRTGFSADPHLLTILVEPLYGKHPSVGVRELMQNSVDAVRELHAWCKSQDQPVESIDLLEQEPDVWVDFQQREDGSWVLRVTDKGIGMTADTLQHYFLRAGASLRRSPQWIKDFVDESGSPRITRVGHFGVGAFATFLLGPSFRIWTRHVGADPAGGFKAEITQNSHLIELQRASGLKVGTTIEVDLSTRDLFREHLPQDYLGLDWYCWPYPKMKITKTTLVASVAKTPWFVFPDNPEASGWNTIHPEGFLAVHWSLNHEDTFLVVNGFKIKSPNSDGMSAQYSWPIGQRTLRAPALAIEDPSGNLHLTAHRYALASSKVPFLASLERDVMLSVISWALVCGPSTQADAVGLRKTHPLMPFDGTRLSFERGPLRWCCSSTEFVLLDGWLHSLLHGTDCLALGGIGPDLDILNRWISSFDDLALPKTRTYVNWSAALPSNEKAFSEIAAERLRGFLDSNALLPGLGASSKIDGAIVLIDHEFEIEPWFDIEFGGDGFTAMFVTNPQDGHYLWYGNTDEPFQAVESLKLQRVELRKPTRNIPESIYRPPILYAANFRILQHAARPETPIARIWEECLGKSAIPFDPAARRRLIAQGSKHPDLKSHIDKWKQWAAAEAAKPERTEESGKTQKR